jgi:hypothetical protein
LLVEAFPAGQLKTWGLPHEGYDGAAKSATTTRRTLVDAISPRLNLGNWGPTLLGSADALDAVLCTFAAIAVSTSKTSTPKSATIGTEGWVAVHP